MTEYIYGTDEQGGHWLTDTEIVRCKDCRFYAEDNSTCWHFGHCELVGFSFERVSSDVEVTPDGFCAWGERKVVD